MTVDRDDRPLLRIVHGGEPTAEEVAALVAAVVTTMRPGAPPDRDDAATSAWAARIPLVRTPLAPGPDAWRRSGWPR